MITTPIVDAAKQMVYEFIKNNDTNNPIHVTIEFDRTSPYAPNFFSKVLQELDSIAKDTGMYPNTIKFANGSTVTFVSKEQRDFKVLKELEQILKNS